MKRGFTLLELVVVIIILGILGTLGTQQYFRMIERARGAEARNIMGQIRSLGAGYLMEHGDLTGFDADLAGIGTGETEVPSSCRKTYYFRYNVTSASDKNLTIVAERCTTGDGGKSPDAGSAANLTLDTDFSSGASGGDSWTSAPLGMY